MEKEIKEITQTSDRWVCIKRGSTQITISSPHTEDSMDTIIDKADSLASKYFENKGNPGSSRQQYCPMQDLAGFAGKEI